jgi:hypothetical protein
MVQLADAGAVNCAAALWAWLLELSSIPCHHVLGTCQRDHPAPVAMLTQID